MSFRAHVNGVYYTVRAFLSDPASARARLFIGVPSYPSHERIAWGSDIVPAMFFGCDPRVTNDIREATHVLMAPGLIERRRPHVPPATSTDFTAVFGLMSSLQPCGTATIFQSPLAPPEAARVSARWFVRAQ